MWMLKHWLLEYLNAWVGNSCWNIWMLKYWSIWRLYWSLEHLDVEILVVGGFGCWSTGYWNIRMLKYWLLEYLRYQCTGYGSIWMLECWLLEYFDVKVQLSWHLDVGKLIAWILRCQSTGCHGIWMFDNWLLEYFDVRVQVVMAFGCLTTDCLSILLSYNRLPWHLNGYNYWSLKYSDVRVFGCLLATMFVGNERHGNLHSDIKILQ